MNMDELHELIRIFEASTLSELEIEEGGRRVRLVGPQPAPVIHSGVMSAAQAVPPEGKASAESTEPKGDKGDTSYQAAGLATIDAPMVGTFYISPAPGEPPFILPGDTVEPGQTVGMVEAMKIMNEVPAKVAGIIEKVLVENGDSVEFGQPLFAIRPLA